MTLQLDYTSRIRQGEDVAGRSWKRVGVCVAHARFEAGYNTRPQFASATGISERTLGTLERGNPVSAKTLRVIERKLEMPLGYLDDVLDGRKPARNEHPDGPSPPLTLVSSLDDAPRASEAPTPPAPDILQKRLHEPLVDERGQLCRDRHGDVLTPARIMSFLEFVLTHSQDGVPAFQRALQDAGTQWGLPLVDRD